jgi:hypothetical protein
MNLGVKYLKYHIHYPFPYITIDHSALVKRSGLLHRPPLRWLTTRMRRSRLLFYPLMRWLAWFENGSGPSILTHKFRVEFASRVKN